MVRVIDARPNNNYWHFIDVWDVGGARSSDQTRVIRIRYVVDVRVSGGSGSWSGSSTRRFSAWVDGTDHARDLTFDTRNGADFVVLEVDQRVFAGTNGRTIPVHGYFAGWSSSFPGYHDQGGQFFVPGVAPPPPPANPPAKMARATISELTPTSARISWTAPQSDRPITDYDLHVCTAQQHSASVCQAHFSWTGSTARAKTLTNLTPGVQYYVGLRADSDAGAGAWSDWAPFRTPSGAYVGKGGSFPAAEVRVGKGGSFVLASSVQVGKGGSFVNAG